MNAFVRYAVGCWIALWICASPLTLKAAESGEEDLAHAEKVKNKDEVDQSVEKGIRYLVANQDPTQGYFQGKLRNTYTGLACIALMAAGHFPGKSEFGDNLKRGILYLSKKSEELNGYYGKEGDARMYGHAICTLALTEAYGMMQTDEDNRLVRDAAERAVKVVLHAQIDDRKNPEHFGGWRYEPNGKDADLSVTVWQVLALRSAENCQLEVSAQSITNAVDYVRRVFVPKDGGYGYQPGKGPSTSMRCAGVVCMRALGMGEKDPDWKNITSSASFLMKLDPSQGDKYFFYQSYYVATASNMMGDDYRNAILPRLQKHLIGLQTPDGSFQNYRGYDGGVYSTAFSVICLAVRYQYLPIYQE
jgi:hypothetical protein